MQPLGRFLKYLGYDVYEWGIGRNRGDVEDYIQRVGKRSRGVAESRDGETVTLIGWSLGGVVARETARLFEPFVREVITMGTPIIGCPKYTAVARRFAEQANIDLDAFEIEVHERNLIGIKQPVTAIYSKSDGVVGWRACVDVYNDHARNIRVNSSHFGLGVNGRVWQLIAETLSWSSAREAVVCGVRGWTSASYSIGAESVERRSPGRLDRTVSHAKIGICAYSWHAWPSAAQNIRFCCRNYESRTRFRQELL